MPLASYLLLCLAATAFAVACISFVQNTRYTNSDTMGASITFDGVWLIGSVLLASGLAIGKTMHWGWCLGLFIAGPALGLLLKWFVLNPLVSVWQRDSPRKPSR